MAELPLDQHQVELTHPAQLRATVRLKSLTRMWSRFELRDLSVLPELPLLREFACRVRGTADLSLIARFPDLRRFSLFHAGSLQHLEILADLPSLQELALPLQSPDGIPGLPVLPKLRHLTLWEVTAQTQLDFLTALSGIELLHLSSDHYSRLPNLAPLTTLYRLRYLTLFNFDTQGLPQQHLDSLLPTGKVIIL